MLDEDIQILRGVGIERRRQNAAIAQCARAELHPPLHPGDDLVVAQLGHGGLDQLLVGQQVAEAQLAVFEHLFDFGRAECRPQAQSFERHALRLP